MRAVLPLCVAFVAIALSACARQTADIQTIPIQDSAVVQGDDVVQWYEVQPVYDTEPVPETLGQDDALFPRENPGQPRLADLIVSATGVPNEIDTPNVEVDSPMATYASYDGRSPETASLPGDNPANAVTQRRPSQRIAPAQPPNKAQLSTPAQRPVSGQKNDLQKKETPKKRDTATAKAERPKKAVTQSVPQKAAPKKPVKRKAETKKPKEPRTAKPQVPRTKPAVALRSSPAPFQRPVSSSPTPAERPVVVASLPMAEAKAVPAPVAVSRAPVVTMRQLPTLGAPVAVQDAALSGLQERMTGGSGDVTAPLVPIGSGLGLANIETAEAAIPVSDTLEQSTADSSGVILWSEAQALIQAGEVESFIDLGDASIFITLCSGRGVITVQPSPDAAQALGKPAIVCGRAVATAIE